MERITFIITLFISILNIIVGMPTCPDAKELQPCTCKPMAYGLHVMCVDFDDSHALVNALNCLREYEVQIVLLHNLMLKEVLPKDLFKNLHISELGVEKSNLTFQQPAFKGLDESLQKLLISKHSVIKSGEEFKIAKLTNLTELSIKKNPLRIVKDELFEQKIPNVISVKLDEDEITKIESKAFAYMPLLQSISIAENRIKVIERSMFPKPAKYLESIDLSGNEIKYLPNNFFSEMDSIKSVILSGNDLTTLPEVTWGKIWSGMKRVVLFDNNLICDNRLSWITKQGWPEQVDGVCVAPSALVGKELREVYDSV